MVRLQYIYGVRALPKGPVKIGIAQNVEFRMKSLQCGNPEELGCIWRAYGTMDDERKLHSIFRVLRRRGEWYDFGELESFIIERALNKAMKQPTGAQTNSLGEWLADISQVE